MNAIAQDVALAVDRDLPLLHRFEQRRLRLGRRAVDLVGKQKLGENRPAGQREAGGLEVEQIGADDVARHQVGRELDPPELQPDRLGEAVRKQGLGRPGRALQEDVSAGKQRHQHQLDRLALADHRFGDLCSDRLGERLDLIDLHD